MSNTNQTIFQPPPADSAQPQLEMLIERIVETTLAKIGPAEDNPFINSKTCAELLGVSPEHLCAMRAKEQGPPWSGQGKWIRYQRSDVIRWIAQLPTTQTSL